MLKGVLKFSEILSKFVFGTRFCDKKLNLFLKSSIKFCRRSEGGNECGMGGHHSVHHLAPRRQHSQTHSEPDNSGVDVCSLQNSVSGIYYIKCCTFSH